MELDQELRNAISKQMDRLLKEYKSEVRDGKHHINMTSKFNKGIVMFNELQNFINGRRVDHVSVKDNFTLILSLFDKDTKQRNAVNAIFMISVDYEFKEVNGKDVQKSTRDFTGPKFIKHLNNNKKTLMLILD